MSPPELYDRIVEICGLSDVLGPGLVRRALADAEASSETAGPAEWERALPHLERRLGAYMSEEEAAQRVREVARLLDASQPEPPAPRPRSPSVERISTPNPD